MSDIVAWYSALYQLVRHVLFLTHIGIADTVQKNPGFLKTQHTGFLGFIGCLALLGFQIFYLNEQLGSLLVHLAHQPSFYFGSPVL